MSFNSLSILSFLSRQFNSVRKNCKLGFPFWLTLEGKKVFDILVWNNSTWTNIKTEEQTSLQKKDLVAFYEEYLGDKICYRFLTGNWKIN